MHQWTANAVRELVDQRLGDASLFVVSNREPYLHEMVPEGPIGRPWTWTGTSWCRPTIRATRSAASG